MDHDAIWLEPAPGADEDYGRQWCQHNVWGSGATEYVRADIADEKIKHMVDRFLSWKLPEDFNPDGGISFKRDYNENTSWPMKHEPSGTNLLDYTQAQAMVRHILEGLAA